jgi:hypothetical protein
MPELIDCFSKAQLPHLRDKYQTMVASGMSEPEAANKIILEEHKKLHNELNTFKKSINLKQDKYEPFDNSEKIKSLNESQDQTPEISKQAEIEKPNDAEVNKTVGGAAEPEAEETVIEGEGETVGIAHAATEEVRKKYRLGDYERNNATDAELEQAADEAINKGYNTETLIEQLEKGIPPTGAENFILKKYLSTLKAKFDKNPTDENLAPIERLVKATDKIGSLQSEAFRTRKGLIPVDDSLAGFFIQEKELNNDAPLTDNQKATVEKEYKNISEADKSYRDKIAKLEEENARLKADQEFKKAKSTTKKTDKKTHEDFVKERDSYRDELKRAKEAHDKWLKDQGIQKQGFGFTLTGDMVKAIGKIIKSHVEEGAQKLEELVAKVYEDVKDIFPGIQHKDIHNVLAGEYNEKKPERKELAQKLFDLKTQAQLVNKLEKLLAGEEPKNEKQKIKRNQEIEGLRQQIKDFKVEAKQFEKEAKDEAARVEKEYKDQQKAEAQKKKDGIKKPSDEEKALLNIKKRTSQQIASLEKDLQTGNYNKEKPQPIKLDAEAKELRDKLVKLKTEREIRIMKQQYENRSRYEKSRDWTIDKLNIPRTIMASMDYSAPLRQGLVAGISHPRTALKASIEMFKSSFSQKNFDRWMYEMREDPRFETMQKSGLSVTDPHSPFLAAKEEAFMNNTAEKIPLIGKLIKGSERAYVMFLNKMRVDLFNRFADRFEEQGKTFENSPELYKATAKLINSETGRGDLGALENAAPILNTVFFSPRLIASRVNLLTNWANPIWYKNTPKEVRVMYAKDMAKFVGTGLTLLALAKYGGNAQVEDDPRSSDFGKIKSGNTRWDIWGGFQQYARLITQMISGEKKSSNTGEIQELDSNGRFGESRSDVGLRFIRGKLAPVPSMFSDWVSGRTSTGDKSTLPGELEQHLTPLLYQDIKSAMQDKGVSSLFTVGIPAVFGVGVQTYSPNSPSAAQKSTKHPPSKNNKKGVKK